ncbi:MAG: hypothetical protein ACR2JY_04565 [Chloroflexota bacterium]
MRAQPPARPSDHEIDAVEAGHRSRYHCGITGPSRSNDHDIAFPQLGLSMQFLAFRAEIDQIIEVVAIRQHIQGTEGRRPSDRVVLGWRQHNAYGDLVA